MKQISLILIFGISFLFAQTNPPKREVRAAWVATVVNLDWPSSRYASVQTQKNELVFILNKLEIAGINTIIFQVRPECDALYDSPYEPWSYWLTGQQGKAPSPLYDPLQFACEEAAKRNMELHAWFNPYRAERLVGNYTLDPSHVAVQHPDWIIQIGTFKFLNPGLPQVREYVAKIIADVVRRYDIEGVHFDDYFYPYPPNNITDEDNATFAEYSRGISDQGDWRRDNVNLLVQAVYDSINAIKPWVKFGISPFGIWKSGMPYGIVGTSSYSAIYCDPVAWLNGQYIDYVNPQIYWKITGPQDYSKLMPWWGSVANGRHIYTGHALYKMTDANNWPASEIENQVLLNRDYDTVQGSVFFRSEFITDNAKGIADIFEDGLFSYYALPPQMPWKDSVLPENPEMLAAEITDQGINLYWNPPATASDGDTAKWYVLYRFSDQEEVDLENPEHIHVIIRANDPGYLDEAALPGESYKYVVTSLDKLKNESEPSNEFDITYTAIEEITSVQPSDFILFQNYPNPFNPRTAITYQLKASSYVDLSIYNILGQKVATLVNKYQPSGIYKVDWDALDMVSGLYFYKLNAGKFVSTKRMLYLK